MHTQRKHPVLRDPNAKQSFTLIKQIKHIHPYCSFIGETVLYCRKYKAIRESDKKECIIKMDFVKPGYYGSHELNNEIRFSNELNNENFAKPINTGRAMLFSPEKDGSKFYSWVIYIACDLLTNITISLSIEILDWPETFIKITMMKLAQAVHYLHSQGLVHLNLRLENILFDQEWDVKLSGLEYVTRDSGFPCYSAYCFEPYSSPEMHSACFPVGFMLKKADIYALGVIFLTIRFGFLPPIEPYPLLGNGFQEDTYWDYLETVSNVKLDYSCKHLLKNMLRANEGQRLTIEQILTHPYLSLAENAEDSMSDDPTQA
jgi:serine/threonine protein kinase